jgi:hypothetical protein
MLGFKLKRGVEASVERIFNSTGRRFDQLSFGWSGKTAAVMFDTNLNGGTTAKIIFPNIDDNLDIPEATHHDLVGFAVHELGHVWFTENGPWDRAREEHGAFVGSLINGLEDPRIEQCVIDSGYAPNARVLFNHVVHSVLLKNGYVEGDDFKNIPFMLAIEGRRLRGYDIPFPSVLPQSPWREDLEWALHQPARDTADIVETAIELNHRLKKDKPKNQPQDQPQDGQDGQGGQQGEDGQEGKQGKSKGKPGKDGKPKGKPKGKGEPKPVELGDALSEQLSDKVPEGLSRVAVASRISVQSFEWE